MRLRPDHAVLAVWLVAVVPASAQQSSASVESAHDTSFTLSSAWKNVIAKYPDAALVSAKDIGNVIARENIVYASVGNRQLHLDLFLPRDSARTVRPAVVLIHGGGWRSGNRQMEWPMAKHIAGRGYVAAAVEYRLSPEALYPAGIYDIKAAIRWLRKHAAACGVDPGRVAVYGCSAGGHLAALVGVTSGLPRFDGGEGDTTCSASVQAIIDIDGILDFTDPAESGKDTGSAPPSAGKSWLGASFPEKPELWRDASPLNHVNKTCPPIVFINSSSERFHAGQDEMIEKLTALNIRSEVHTLPGTPHTFWLFHPWFEQTCGIIDGFLDRTLKNGN